MNTKKREPALDNFEDYGYMMAQLNLAFASWVEKKRHFNAKVSMRSGHPILHAAKYLGKRGQANFCEWDEMWLNQTSMRNSYYENNENVAKYIVQEGLDKPFTLIDNGYKGTLSNVLTRKYGNKDLQTLLMIAFGSLSINKTQDAFFHGYSQLAYRLQDIVELMPQEYYSFDEDNYIEYTQGKIIVDKLRDSSVYQGDAFHSFHTGLEKGFVDCYDAVQSGDKAQFGKYIDALCASQLVPVFQGEMKYVEQRLPEDKRKIQDIYEKG